MGDTSDYVFGDEAEFDKLFQESVMHMQLEYQSSSEASTIKPHIPAFSTPHSPPKSPVSIDPLPFPPPPWRLSGSSLIGCRLTRTIPSISKPRKGTKRGNRNTLVPAVVIGWLDQNESDFFDSQGNRAPLWKVYYTDGELKGDMEDLEEHQVIESIDQTQSSHALNQPPQNCISSKVQSHISQPTTRNKSNADTSTQREATGKVSNTKGSKYKGVDKTSDGKWRSRICVQGKQTIIGYHSTELEAALKYDEVAMSIKKPTNFKQGIISTAKKKKEPEKKSSEIESLTTIFNKPMQNIAKKSQKQTQKNELVDKEVEKSDDESSIEDGRDGEAEEEDSFEAPMEHSSPRLAGIPSRLQKYGEYVPPQRPSLDGTEHIPEAQVASIRTHTLKAPPPTSPPPDKKKAKKAKQKTPLKKNQKVDLMSSLGQAKKSKEKGKKVVNSSLLQPHRSMDGKKSKPVIGQTVMDSLASPNFMKSNKKRKAIKPKARQSKKPHLSDSDSEDSQDSHYSNKDDHSNPRDGSNSSDDDDEGKSKEKPEFKFKSSKRRNRDSYESEKNKGSDHSLDNDVEANNSFMSSLEKRPNKEDAMRKRKIYTSHENTMTSNICSNAKGSTSKKKKGNSLPAEKVGTVNIEEKEKNSRRHSKEKLRLGDMRKEVENVREEPSSSQKNKETVEKPVTFSYIAKMGLSELQSDVVTGQTDMASDSDEEEEVRPSNKWLLARDVRGNPVAAGASTGRPSNIPYSDTPALSTATTATPTATTAGNIKQANALQLESQDFHHSSASDVNAQIMAICNRRSVQPPISLVTPMEASVAKETAKPLESHQAVVMLPPPAWQVRSSPFGFMRHAKPFDIGRSPLPHSRQSDLPSKPPHNYELPPLREQEQAANNTFSYTHPTSPSANTPIKHSEQSQEQSEDEEGESEGYNEEDAWMMEMLS